MMTSIQSFPMTPRVGVRLLLGIGAVVAALLPSVSLAADLEEEPRLPLALEVFLKKPAEHVYEIHIHLTNVSAEPLAVDVHDLPWTPPNDSKWFSAVRLDAHRSPMAQNVFRGNFGSRNIRLVPGESVQDTLVLNHRFPSLLKDIQHFGVQLQWDCPPASLKFVCKPGAPHSIMIPKGDPGQPDVYAIDDVACRRLERAIGLIDILHDHAVLFLLTTEPVMTDLERAQSLLYKVDDYVQGCKPMWTNSWAVSFFTEKRFAGFVHDLKNKPYFEKGLWQRANIGQYSSQIRMLFRFPWIRNKADSVYLSVYR